MSKHTPGPWQVRLTHQTERTYATILAAPGDIACVGSSRGMPSETIDANARLIAAAPDLLAACEAALAAHDGANRSGRATWTGGDVDAMRAAVAKAKGESCVA